MNNAELIDKVKADIRQNYKQCLLELHDFARVGVLKPGLIRTLSDSMAQVYGHVNVSATVSFVKDELIDLFYKQSWE